MKTSSSFLFKCPRSIRGTLLAVVWISVGTICAFADPPTVTIVQPAEGASFAGPVDVTIEATASDSDGFVTQVDFYWFPCGFTTLLASFTAPPYSFTLTNLISGNFSVSVSVLDNGGNQTVSNFVFNVVGPIQSLVNAAAPGSTVDIPAGVHHDTVVINKNLTLRGAGARSTAIDGNNGCTPVLFVTGGATVTLSGLMVTRGGIVNDSTLTVNDCAITGNDNQNGIHNLTSGTLFVNNCTVSGNLIPNEGAGVLNEGTMILNACTISGNVCGVGPFPTDGGGVANYGTLSLNNCTVTANSALFDHGSGGGGGGVAANSGTVNCKGTIIANNFGPGNPANGFQSSPDFRGDLNSQGYNLIGNTSGAVILGITTGNLLNIDPLLGPLQNNGGPTDTHALLAGSPAIDAGISGGLTTDQRGGPRPTDAPPPNVADGSDIGAYEFNSIYPTIIIDTPVEGQSFAGPTNVTIEATLIDHEGIVSGVDFISFSEACGNVLLGTVTAPPYRFTLTNLLSGDYRIFVCAQPGSFCASVGFSVVGPIQSLVNAAAPGSTVDIPAGVYLDTVVINKDLTLRGAGARSTAIDGHNACQAALFVTGGATVTVTDLTVTRGGIVNDSTLTVNECAIAGNGFRSGIQNTISGSAFINNCAISGNGLLSSVEGAGIDNDGTMTLNGCTISGNISGVGDEAGGFGGGLANGRHGTLTLNNCTVTGNTAQTGHSQGGYGGGIANLAPGIVNCKSTIIANNFGTELFGAGPDFLGDLTSQGHNLIGNTAGTVILGVTAGNLLNVDPLLGPLQNNGGPTDTHALLAGSPSLDAGISGGPTTDQRGFPRSVDIPSVPNAADGSDIGAYEFNSGAPALNITCPADIAANNDPSECSAVVNYPAPLVSGGTGNVVVVCNPLSGSVFPVGTTTVTCTATDESGNTAECSFKVTVNDTQPPQVRCVVVRAAALRQNPLRITGWFQLLATDNCDPDPLLYLKGSVGSFVAGPFHNGDQVEISHGPSLIPRQAPSTFGGNVASIQLNGDALLWAVDSSGNASTPVKCR